MDVLDKTHLLLFLDSFFLYVHVNTQSLPEPVILPHIYKCEFLVALFRFKFCFYAL